MSKVLVVMYSYTGTSRQLAQLLCSQQKWPLGEIQEMTPRGGMRGIWRCLMDSWRRRRPQIRYTGPAPNDFDAVVLVSPIWAYRLASPMRSFVASRLGQFRDVAVISVMGGRGASSAVEEVSRLLGRAPILTTAFTQREVEDGSYAARLQAFGVAVQTSEDRRDIVRPDSLSPQTV